ncbi:MAG TPA: low temperature requirement protein A [Nocardioidaceae bacterium]|nr:low temperature requirement protein A [Nocardioidaceae bacterium]
MTEHRTPLHMEATDEGQAVTTLELFFDLVFVFALTQVTAFMAADPSATRIVQGMLALAILWWAWVGYAWLCNLVKADEGSFRVILLTAMVAMFVLALSIPEAFDDRPGGLYGPLVLPICYLVFRLAHLVLFLVVAQEDEGLRTQLIRWVPSVFGGSGLLLVASAFDGAAQIWLWVAALAADYLGTLLIGASGWRLPAPGHFAERHGLIVIVALGESIVAIGVGAEKLPISWPIVVAAAAGLAISASLWWLYFDAAALFVEEELRRLTGVDRTALARDAYSFLHLPLIAGIVLLALGLKKSLEYVGDTGEHMLSDPLHGVPLVALYGGVVLYMLGHMAFKWRALRRLSRDRIVGLIAVVATGFLVYDLRAVGQLLVLAGVLVALVAFESLRHAEERREIRHAGH